MFHCGGDFFQSTPSVLWTRILCSLELMGHPVYFGIMPLELEEYFVGGHCKSTCSVSSHINVKIPWFVFCHKSSLLSDCESVAQDEIVIDVYVLLLGTLFLSSQKAAAACPSLSAVELTKSKVWKAPQSSSEQPPCLQVQLSYFSLVSSLLEACVKENSIVAKKAKSKKHHWSLKSFALGVALSRIRNCKNRSTSAVGQVRGLAGSILCV